jgi:hypothetical protein
MPSMQAGRTVSSRPMLSPFVPIYVPPVASILCYVIIQPRLLLYHGCLIGDFPSRMSFQGYEPVRSRLDGFHASNRHKPPRAPRLVT